MRFLITDKDILYKRKIIHRMQKCPYLQKLSLDNNECLIIKTKITKEYFEKFCSNDYVNCRYYEIAKQIQIKNAPENTQLREPLRVKIIDDLHSNEPIKKESTNVQLISRDAQSLNIDINSMLNELNNAWHHYEMKVKEIITRWETEKEKILSKILNEHSKLDSILIREEELEGRKIIGLITDEEYNTLKVKINEEKKIIENKIRELVDYIIFFEKGLSLHRRRLNLMLKQEDLDTLNKKLADLESAKEKSIISNITYEKLKREIIFQINLLKEIYRMLD
ncbi:MAG: hypothetical protein ACP5GU_00080 [Thermoprotei archaeon]